MNHEIIPQALDELISDIHELIDEKQPEPETEEEDFVLPDYLEEELPQSVPEESALEAPEEEPQQEEQPQRWTDRQKVPKHVARLQQNQQQAYAQWLKEQEEKGDVPPPEFPEERPRGKKHDETEQPLLVTEPKKRTCLWVALGLVLITLLAALTAVWLIPKQPKSGQEGLRSRGSVSVLLAGADESMARTDMLMLLSMDRRDRKLSLVSIPRDTQTEDGVSLGTVYGRAGGGEDGVEALKQAVAAEIGYLPDGCVVLHPQSVTEFISALGGIRFDVPMAVKLADAEVEAGTRVLDGQQAYAILRSGGAGQADLERSETQRQFLSAVIRQCVKPAGIIRAPGLLDALTSTTVTDMNTRNFLWLARTALSLDLSGIYTDVLPGSVIGATYCPNTELALQTVNAYCSPYLRTITADDLQISQE